MAIRRLRNRCRNRGRGWTTLAGSSAVVYGTLILVVLTSCRGAEEASRSRGRLSNPSESPADLGAAVVEALNASDKYALNGLRVDKNEYIDHLWYSFPASANFPADFAYANLEKKCIKGINRWVGRYGGRDLSFVDIRFERPTEVYTDFKLLRGTVLRVRGPDGKEHDLKVLGSVVEMDGRYKLLSYDDG